MCFYISTDIPGNDINPLNNQRSFCIPVVNSFDPNIKTVLPAGNGPLGIIPSGNSSLEYTVHFQNTGTAPAINVTIIDTLESDILPYSLHILNTSHTVSPSWLAPNVVRFYFQNIQLPDSSTNEPGSHGQISFTVAIDSTLVGGSTIENRACIYFDSNPPVITGYTLNTIDIPQGNGLKLSSNCQVLVYPNPFNEYTQFSWVNYKPKGIIQLEIFNLQGHRKVHIQTNSASGINLNKGDLAEGVYFFRLTDSAGIIGNGKLVVK